MKKRFIKSVAVSLAVMGIVAVGQVSTSAATKDLNLINGIGRNIPTNPFYEINEKTTNVIGSNVFTQSNLPEAAKNLYNANPEEGAKVVNIINHANFYSERYYAQDGKGRGNKDAYKNGYIGYCLYYYMPQTANAWHNALYNTNGFLENLDKANAGNGLRFAESGVNNNTPSTIVSETMIAQYINMLVEYGAFGCTGDKEYSSQSTKLEYKALSSKQKEIKSTNYAFAVGAEEDYDVAFRTFKRAEGGAFNKPGEALRTAFYGELIYLRAKEAGLDMAKAREWVESSYDYDDSTNSMIDYIYIQNALLGFDNAKDKNISTYDQAGELAFELINNRLLIKINPETKGISILQPYREMGWNSSWVDKVK